MSRLFSQLRSLELVRETDGKIMGHASFTMAEATAAGLAQKDNYRKWGPDMLWARCSARLVGRYVPWVLYWKTLPKI